MIKVPKYAIPAIFIAVVVSVGLMLLSTTLYRQYTNRVTYPAYMESLQLEPGDIGAEPTADTPLATSIAEFEAMDTTLFYTIGRLRDTPYVIDGKNAESLQLLESDALRIYNQILRGIVGGCYDFVIEDPRACHAIRIAFGSLRALASLPDNDYINQKDKEAFVKAYVTAPNALNDVNHVFECYRGTDGSPLVRFIGNWDNCKKLADDYYLNQGAKPRYPDNPSVKKQLPRPQTFVQERPASSQEIRNFIKELKSMVTA